VAAAVTTQTYEVTARDRRARRSTAAAYVVQGLCFAGVLTRVPALKDKFGFSDGELSLILLVVPVVAGAGSVLAGALAARLGSALVLRVAGPGVCAAMLAIGAAGTRPLLFLAVAAFGLVIGAVDATMNMQGVAVQRRYGRSLLMSFHGAWSMAGIASSLATAGAERIELPLVAGIAVVSVVGAVVALVAGPSLLRGDEERAFTPEPGKPPTRPGAHPSTPLPWGPILLVGIAVTINYIADSATSNWSAVYVRDALEGSRSVAALGLGAYLTCQVIGRLFADRVVSRFGPARTVAAGAVVGAAGMAIVVAAPTPAVGIAGFAVVGFGLCVVVPQSFSAADAVDPSGSGVAIARVNLFNYIGFVVGAALIGAVAEGASLRLAFAVPGILVLGIVALARAFSVRSIAAL
jgi:predicted MFS family arabinose efflux permease